MFRFILNFFKVDNVLFQLFAIPILLHFLIGILCICRFSFICSNVNIVIFAAIVVPLLQMALGTYSLCHSSLYCSIFYKLICFDVIDSFIVKA